MPMILQCLLLVLVPFVPHDASARTQSRYAVVVGNADYARSPLHGPLRDSQEVARTLQQLGFEVERIDNADARAMRRARARYAEWAALPNTLVFFYFSGHGSERAGRSSLEAIEGDRGGDLPPFLDVQADLVEIRRGTDTVTVIVLDMCRLEANVGKLVEARAIDLRRAPPLGALVAYATSTDSLSQAAADRPSGMSSYTEQLVRELTAPGVSLETVFQRARNALRTKEGWQQVPVEQSSLTSQVFLVPAIAGLEPPQANPETVLGRLDQALAAVRVSDGADREAIRRAQELLRVFLRRDLTMEELLAVSRVPFSVGARFAQVPAYASDFLGVREGDGVMITEIQDFGLARQLDLREGDVLVSLNGRTISSVNELQVISASLHPGTEVTAAIVRNRIPQMYTRAIVGSSIEDRVLEAIAYNFHRRDFDRTRELCEAIAVRNGQANALLAQLAFSGIGGRTSPDYEEMSKRAQAAADAGATRGLWWLMVAYQRGLYVAKSGTRANEIRGQALALGASWAHAGLAYALMSGEGGVARAGADRSVANLARIHAERAAMQGSADGMLLLGKLYEYGVGVPRNPEAAGTWYQRAIDSGYAEAGKVAREQLDNLRRQIRSN